MPNPQPLGGNEMPRFGGIATFMRLPGKTPLDELDAAVVGVPFDIGTSNRPGARFGPRGVRDESVLLRPYNMATRAAPFDSLVIDDTGDVATNAFNLEKVFESAMKANQSLDTIEAERSPVCRPDSDCWDVKLIFFQPDKQFEVARKVFRFTVDVSDVVPVLVGDVRQWSIR